MKYPIKLDSISRDLEFYTEVESLLANARNYLNSHKWCRKVLDGWLFTNIGYTLNIYLFDIENSQSPYDNFIWVIVGDFPSMYLDTINVLTTKGVIDTYITLAEDWIAIAKKHESLDDCFPFEVEADNIELFETKVSGLKKLLCSNINDINFKLALNQ